MKKYMNILREDEITKANEIQEQFIIQYGFELLIKDIAISMSKYDKVNQSGFSNELPALLGD